MSTEPLARASKPAHSIPPPRHDAPCQSNSTFRRLSSHRERGPGRIAAWIWVPLLVIAYTVTATATASRSTFGDPSNQVALLSAAPNRPASLDSVPLPGIGASYLQDFDSSLAVSGTGSFDSLPSGWAAIESGGGANASYAADDGNSATADTYSYGSPSSSDRALGALQGGLGSTFGLSLANDTGQIIHSLAISYAGEQWRLGATGRNDRLEFQYSYNATTLTSGSWYDLNLLDFVAPQSSGSVGPLDGNAAANRTVINNSLIGLLLPPGKVIWLRWTSTDVAGADDGLAIDAITITPLGVPTWDLGEDFRHAPAMENPSRDRHGNPDVWTYMVAAGLSRNPATYTPLSHAIVDGGGFAGLDSWDIPGQFPHIEHYNGSLDLTFGCCFISPQMVTGHPDNARLLVVRWTSPYSQTVRAHGMLRETDPNGDGELFFIEKGATNLASGFLAPAGTVNFKSATGATNLEAIPVAAGESLYLIIHPNGGYLSDSIQLVFSIDPTTAPASSTYPSTASINGSNGIIGAGAPPGGGVGSMWASAGGGGCGFRCNGATGDVFVTNARRRGTYTVTIRRRNSAGESTETVALKVRSPTGCIAPGFASSVTTEVGDAAGRFTAGDFNGDGLLDLAVTSGTPSNRVRVFPGNGAGGFGAATANQGFALEPASLASADINGDGRLDLIAGLITPGCCNSTGQLALLLGNGAGGLDLPSLSASSRPLWTPVIADFNLDTQPDVGTACLTASTAVQIFRDPGNSTLAQTLSAGIPAGPVTDQQGFVDADDFTGDGKPDILVGAPVISGVAEATLTVFPGTGTGSLGAPIQSYLGYSGTGDDAMLGGTVGDFNQDGVLDVAVGRPAPSELRIALGTGTGSFGAATPITLAVLPDLITAGDLNGDGQTDLVVGTRGSATLKTFLGRGNGSFEADSDVVMPAGIVEILIADFNNDAREDLAATGGTSNQLYIRLSNCTAVVRGDCNNDGALDAGDLSALPVEVFDADGPWALDAPGSTFPGITSGCDPNQDARVDAADVTCVVLKLFGGSAACGE